MGWVQANTKAIQAIGDHVITHNTRYSMNILLLMWSISISYLCPYRYIAMFKGNHNNIICTYLYTKDDDHPEILANAVVVDVAVKDNKECEDVGEGAGYRDTSYRISRKDKQR